MTPVERIVRRVEPHLADAVSEDGVENIQESCYTLCVDAAFELGYEGREAGELAQQACVELVGEDGEEGEEE